MTTATGRQLMKLAVSDSQWKLGGWQLEQALQIQRQSSMDTEDLLVDDRCHWQTVDEACCQRQPVDARWMTTGTGFADPETVLHGHRRFACR